MLRTGQGQGKDKDRTRTRKGQGQDKDKDTHTELRFKHDLEQASVRKKEVTSKEGRRRARDIKGKIKTGLLLTINIMFTLGKNILSHAPLKSPG